MAGGGRKSADSKLVVGLAAGDTVQRAAKAAGVSERTVYRRLENREFRCRINESRAAFIEQALGKLADASTKAVDALVDLLDNDSATAKLGAARAVLEHVGKFREQVEFNDRIEQLERQINERQRSQRSSGRNGAASRMSAQR